ncbi:MAG: hypothetical protein JWO67_3496 [Streptosporangiaceae bacterium]|jgi:hypothetical protein|nr:hypothetical protein [Streptosporangiaceae bacterium]
MTANPWVRPYVLTGGRTRTRQHLYVHTLVSVRNYDPSFAAGLLPEARSLYERAHAGPESVAELSANCGISLGVTRVLLGDLAAGNWVLINPENYRSPYDPSLLKRVIHGLRELA